MANNNAATCQALAVHGGLTVTSTPPGSSRLTTAIAGAALGSMSRARPAISSLCQRWLVCGLFGAVLALSALLFAGRYGAAAAAPSADTAGPSLRRASLPPRAVEAVPRRLVHEGRRDGRACDDFRAPVRLAALGTLRVVRVWHQAAGLGPGWQPPHALRNPHLRRRLPRMNSEDPPSVDASPQTNSAI